MLAELLRSGLLICSHHIVLPCGPRGRDECLPVTRMRCVHEPDSWWRRYAPTVVKRRLYQVFFNKLLTNAQHTEEG